jgi:cystathionine beta-lyase family protein involved in aluminum resistance
MRDIAKLCADCEEALRPRFAAFDAAAAANTARVLAAFQKRRVTEACFIGSTGYGYGDIGRDTLDAVYADVFGTEAALVRIGFVSGTHAIGCMLFAALRPGQALLSATGAPYDTLRGVIGLTESGGFGSLRDYGVGYEQMELLPDGSIDIHALREKLSGAPGAAHPVNIGAVFFQRSRGYSARRALSAAEIAGAAALARSVNPGVAVLVDNCYGEFTETAEPDADLLAGSLIKNPGGGLALTGGYVAGRKDLVERAAARLTMPGIGGHYGATLDQNRSLYQGLFMAPTATAAALKTAALAAALLSRLGYAVSPGPDAPRHDIIQSVDFGCPDALLRFCRGIQAGSPVDAHLTPEPWDMPGYDVPVVMAAGGFVQGASIELSCDAPMSPPYTAFLQGGLTYEAGRAGVLAAIAGLS